jgi:hypothetical protein
LNWRRWTEAGDAPHGKVFYGFTVLFGALGTAFFCSVAVSQLTDASVVWRILFAIPATFFLFGVLQSLERLVLPERARLRSGGLTEGVRLRILVARWVALVVSLAGCGVATLVRFIGNPGIQDACDDLRILFFSLVFLCYCLADLAGETVFPYSMLTTAWRRGAKDGSGGLAKRKRRRRSLY